MAYADVPAYSTYSGDAAASHNVPLPAGTVAGSKLIVLAGEAGLTGVVVAVDHTATSTEVSQGYLVYSPTAADAVAVIVLRVTGSSGFSATPDESGNSANPNPPTHYSSDDTVWLSVVAHIGDIAHTAFSTNYPNHQIAVRFSDPTNGIGVAVCSRNLNASSEDPGAHTLASATDWGAITIAIAADTNGGVGSGGIGLDGEGVGGTDRSGTGGGGIEIGGGGTGQAIPCGTGEGGITLSGSGNGSTERSGSGEGGIELGGSGIGEAPVLDIPGGIGAGGITISGTGVGEAIRSGTGSGGLALSGSGIGESERAGTGSGDVVLGGSGIGEAFEVASGTGFGVISLDGSGIGSVDRGGTGTGGLTLSGSGIGEAPDLSIPGGTGEGGLTLDGDGIGYADPGGTGQGGIDIDGSGIGEAFDPAAGAGCGGIELGGSGTGAADRGGTGSGGLTLGGTGIGEAPGLIVPGGTGEGGIVLDSSGIGEAPTLVIPGGTGSGGIALAGTASGYTSRSGTGSGGISLSGSGSAYIPGIFRYRGSELIVGHNGGLAGDSRCCGSCCKPWEWDWSVTLNMIGSGSPNCVNYSGTYLHPRDSFIEGVGGEWISEFNVGLDWAVGFPVYSWLRLAPPTFGTSEKYKLSYRLYFVVGSVFYIFIQDDHGSDECEPAPGPVNSTRSSPCSLLATAEFAAVM